jgi:hypothetical protein
MNQSTEFYYAFTFSKTNALYFDYCPYLFVPVDKTQE